MCDLMGDIEILFIGIGWVVVCDTTRGVVYITERVGLIDVG